MSAGGSVFAQSVLILTTDRSRVREGLDQARLEVTRETQAISNAAKVQLRADLNRLQSDFNAAERSARDASAKLNRESTFDLRMNLAKYQSDLRMAEREQAESLRRMRQEAQSSGGGLGQFGQAALSGAGFAGGAAAVTAAVAGTIGAVKSGVGTVLEYNAAIQQSRNQILGFTNDQRAVQQVTVLANKAVAEGRGTFRETYQALADLTPLARTYNADLGELLKTAQILAAVDPAQGFEGASVALREALSGDFTSLTRRFEIPRAEIQRLKDEGVPNLEIVKRALAGLGISDNVLTTQAQNFNQQLKIAGDEFRRFLADAGKPIFDAAGKGLAELRAQAGSPEFQALGATLRDAATGAASLTTELLHAAEAALTLLGRIALINQQLNDPNGPVERFINTYFPGGGPGTGAVAIPSLPNPYPAPDTSTNPVAGNFDPEYNPRAGSALPDFKAIAAQRQREAFLAGQAELKAYLDGFTSQSYTAFNAIKPQLQAAFDRLYGSLTADEQAAKGAGQIDVLAARITDDIRKYGAVSVETGNRVRAILGDQAADVLKLANAYGALVAAQAQQTAATFAAAQAAGELAIARGRAAKAEEDGQKKIAALEATAKNHATAAENEVRALQSQSDAIGREADAVARGYDKQLRGLQATAAAMSRAAEEAQRALADQLRAAQADQQRAQEAASLHAAAYAAVLAGTTDEFLRQNQALDEQTRKIIENGNAQVRAALQAKTAQDDKVNQLEASERAKLLDYEERIRAARNQRTPQGEAEARRLEAERDRERARAEYQLDLERQRAAVAGDRAKAAAKPVEAAAQAQADADKAAVDAAGKRVNEIQEQARQRAEADRQAQQAIQDQIAGVQEQARAAAEMYADRQRGIGEEIRLVNERARQQAIADQAAIDGANTALDLVKQIEGARVAAAQKGADNAQLAANRAKTEYDWQNQTLGILGQQNSILNDRLKAFQDFIDKNPGILGAPSLNPAAPRPSEPGVGLTGPDGTVPPAPSPGGGGGLHGKQLRAAFAPLPAVPVPAPLPTFRIPAPPAAPAWASAAAGGLAFARAAGSPGGGGITLTGPFASFPNATIRETVEIERAIRGGADLALARLQEAFSEDHAGGGASSRWGG